MPTLWATNDFLHTSGGRTTCCWRRPKEWRQRKGWQSARPSGVLPADSAGAAVSAGLFQVRPRQQAQSLASHWGCSQGHCPEGSLEKKKKKKKKREKGEHTSLYGVFPISPHNWPRLKDHSQLPVEGWAGLWWPGYCGEGGQTPCPFS